MGRTVEKYSKTKRGITKSSTSLNPCFIGVGRTVEKYSKTKLKESQAAHHSIPAL
jgi:hypothetical protein